MRTVPSARFQLLLPESRRERFKGLRGRPPPAPDQAVLFERCRSIHTFGMRFPILVAWLDDGCGVIAVRRVKPRRLASNFRARHALECAIDADVRVGDVIELSGAASPG